MDFCELHMQIKHSYVTFGPHASVCLPAAAARLCSSASYNQTRVRFVSSPLLPEHSATPFTTARALNPSMMPRGSPTMSAMISHGCLNYNKCTSAELLKFIKARSTVATDRRIARKDELVACFQQPDRSQTFRLLGLPTESRLHVYRCTLTGNGIYCSGREACLLN